MYQVQTGTRACLLVVGLVGFTLLAIAGGASGDDDAEWWAFRPIASPKPPVTPFDELVRNPIDRFVFAKLAEKGLSPSVTADRLTLLRRVTVDLTGLPPTPEEVDAFQNDPSPDAYERVVDRLLASPAHGERWARHWLDVVRFGESHGYEQNHLRPNAWHYRDYVIRAFNEDKPYDQFVLEQLAGDVVGAGNRNVEVATGFLVAGVHDTVGIQNEEGSRQQRANDLDDVVSTTGAAFLGLTIGCARCHDHKFDPIPQEEYYRLAAVFAGVRHGERALAPANAGLDPKNKDRAERALRDALARIMDLENLARHAVLRSQGLNPVPRPAVNVRRNVEEFPSLAARFVRFTILATRDGAEPCLDEIEIHGPDGNENLALAGAGAKATASSLLPGYPIHQVEHLNDGKFGNDWSWISNEPGRGWVQIELPRVAMVNRITWSRDSQAKPRFQDRLATSYRVETSLDGQNWNLVATGEDRSAAPEAIPADQLAAALSAEQRAARTRLHAEADALRRELAEAAPPMAYVGQFTTPDAIHVLKRGDVMRPGAVAQPGALSAIPGLPPELDLNAAAGEPGRRVALARWITHPSNPLTPRVLVNRLWQHHFGQGLVATPSDLGKSGIPPTHPELLDWLANDFVANGWRLKRLHRLMVTSHVYRQASASRPEAVAIDAGNQYLWRMPLRRMEGEAIRDAVLAASGKLDRRMGGPGFQLFQYKVVNVGIYEPLEDQGPETWRRGIYQQAARAYREDMLANFDCPECAQRMPRRDVTTTPLQALAMLNGRFVVQQSEFLAERVRREAGPNAGEQIERAFRLCFGRLPSSAESAAAERLVADHGMATLCRGLLNANEFVHY